MAYVPANWEFTNDMANEDNMARVTRVQGTPPCRGGGTNYFLVTPRTFRCCYSR